MTLSTLLDLWRNTPTIAQNIAAWRTLPARPARTVPFPPELHPDLCQTLHDRGIDALYTHQATTWEHIRAGRHPVIATGTASGKTLCYNLPILHQLLTDSQIRALYLFPTKALAHDQRETLTQLTAGWQQEPSSAAQNSVVSIAAYDGDTPTSARPAIRARARLILSNPDMLHTAILPHHTKWADFFRQLHFVVIDEMHVYRGVFGSHVANVLRRLKRVAHFYGAAAQFILTSATIANPTELAGQLIEEGVTLVDDDGSARGPKHFLIYNPPIINSELGLRRSVLQESVRLAQDLLQHNIQTIIFGRTRRTVERLLRYLREDPGFAPAEGPSQGRMAPARALPRGKLDDSPIRAYRSGYLPRQRREIERGLRDGDVRMVVATSALELGIDIGRMGAALLTGYPGTIAGTWQQAGRAGRQNEVSLAILLTSANPLDQFLAHHPSYFFERAPEQALINPDNLLILYQHLHCAAFELPFQVGDNFGQVSATQLAEFLQFMQESGELHQSGSQYFWMADQYPAEKVSLRSASPDRVRLLTGDEAEAILIGEVDAISAPWMVHPQAIYLHEGEAFEVETLDQLHNIARLRPSRVDYYTEPQRDTTVQLVECLAHSQFQAGSKNLGQIIVTSHVIGYRMVQWFTHERLGDGQVELPPNELHTTGYWLTLAPETVDKLRAQGLWTNDPNDYGPNWSLQRKRARTRDGYRCQVCGTPEQHHQHDVHHKIPFRTFDSYEQANRLTNLITLCRSCHRRAESGVQMRSGLSGMATALGHLAPLFLMCDRHDVGVHADPQSALAGGQPAVIIYDMVPAGIGFSERLFELHAELVTQAYDLVASCSCTEGCPSCVGPAGEDGRGGKQEATALLKALLIGVTQLESKNLAKGS